MVTSLVSTQADLLGSHRYVLRGPDGSEANISELRESFRQGFVLEVLDLSTGAPPSPRGDGGSTFVFPLNPTRYTLTEPFQNTLTPAENDTVVTEENGIITREIVLEGTFGLSQKRATGFLNVQGNGARLSGTDHFNLLRNFFRHYSALKKDPATAANVVMVFHALRDDDHFVVVPTSFESPRDAGSNRVHYQYRLQMTAVEESTVSGLVPRVETTSYNFTQSLRDITNAFNSARAAVAEVTANIAEIRRKVQNINTVFQSAAGVLNAVGGFVNGTVALINTPLQAVASAAESLSTAADTLTDAVASAPFGVLAENARSLRRIEAAFDVFMMYPDKFQDEVARVEDFFAGETRATTDDYAAAEASGASAPGQDGAGGMTVGSRTRAARGDGLLAGLSVPRGSALRAVAVAATDTLESIANTARTTPEAIIIINDLRPPYITRSGGPGVLKPGDSILVPSPGSPRGSGTSAGASEYLTPEEAVYGIDIGLDADALRDRRFDIAVNTAGGALDFEVARGVRNVVQGTEITIGTERGTTLFAPDIGIRRNVGQKGTTQHVLMASILLREAILADPRVAGIESARVVYDSATGALELEVSPTLLPAQSGVTLILPFGRASSG